MKQIIFIALSSLLLISIHSCSSGNKNLEGSLKKEGTEEKISANRKISIEIEGMVCKQGCGSSIQRALKSTGGVAFCNIDFENKRKTNIATIGFDKEKITADKIIDIVTSINEKQFSVAKSTVVSVDENVDVQENTSSSKAPETSKINVSERSFEMPNLLKLFSGLLSR